VVERGIEEDAWISLGGSIGMARPHLFHEIDRKLRITLQHGFDHHLQHTQQMLFAAVLSTLAVVLVAAAMMTRL
jgi:hypothetical protein